MAKWYYPASDNKQGAQLEELFTKTHTSSEATRQQKSKHGLSFFNVFYMIIRGIISEEKVKTPIK